MSDFGIALHLRMFLSSSVLYLINIRWFILYPPLIVDCMGVYLSPSMGYSMMCRRPGSGSSNYLAQQ